MADKNTAPQTAVIDGFLYNPKLLYAPNRYLPLALEEMMPYRSYKYSHRYYSAPTDPTIAIAAGATVDTQLRIIPGSVITGARICTLDGAAASDLMYLIRDSDTQKNFTDGRSRYINCTALVPTGASGAAYCVFGKPYQVSGSGNDNGGGVIVVSISNRNANTAIKCQLTLWVAEPAQMPTNAQSGSVMLIPPGSEPNKPNPITFASGLGRAR